MGGATKHNENDPEPFFLYLSLRKGTLTDAGDGDEGGAFIKQREQFQIYTCLKI